MNKDFNNIPGIKKSQIKQLRRQRGQEEEFFRFCSSNFCDQLNESSTKVNQPIILKMLFVWFQAKKVNLEFVLCKK